MTSQTARTSAFLQKLVRSGADVNDSDVNGRTALHTAASKGETGAVRLLLARGANVNARDRSGATPLWMAVYHGHTDTARMLLQGGADARMATGDGVTPTLLALRRGFFTTLWALVRECGVDLDERRPLLTFCMGQHQRLGAGSAAHCLPEDLMPSISKLIVTERASDSTLLARPEYASGAQLLRWLEDAQHAAPVYAKTNDARRRNFVCATCSATADAVALVPCGHRRCRTCWESRRRISFCKTCPECAEAVLLAVPQEQWPDHLPLP